MELKDRKEQLAAELRSASDGRNETIPYRGEPTLFPVVKINSRVPLLNHDNSRLSAQLKGHPKAHVVQSDPFSAEAQDILADLLRKTEKFAALKGELETLGQQHPGIITSDGVLINGNTRLVATRDLGDDGFLVAVLPESATSEDFLNIEMDLQVRKLTHQDYTFTNELLLIDRYMQAHTEKDLFTRMNWQKAGQRRLQERQRWLALIEEIRSLTDPPLGYEFFDDQAEMLKNLDAKYEEIRTYSVADAESMKWLRITGVLVGANKDQVRALEPEFIDEELAKRVDKPGEDFLQRHLKPVEDDLDDLFDTDDQTPVETLDLRSAAKEILNQVLSPDGKLDDAKLEEFAGIRTAIRRGADAVIDREKRAKELKAPSEVLKEARLGLEEVVENLPLLFSDSGFNSRKFQYEADKVERALKRLTEELKRLSNEAD